MLIFATLVSACVCVWVLCVCVCVYSQTNAGGGRGRSRARVNTQTQGTLVAYPPSDARAAARRAFMSAATSGRASPTVPPKTGSAVESGHERTFSSENLLRQPFFFSKEACKTSQKLYVCIVYWIEVNKQA